MLKKAVAYARVSSKEQEKEGFSIPAQQKLLREYAAKNDIEIVREYADAETAKSTGREQFGEMLKYLKCAHQVKAVLVEKTDRLYRNFRDYVMIDDEEIEIHLVKEGEVLSRESRSHQKFIHGIKVLMAKNYIDNLSEEVKKGLYEKAANGQYPGQAPTGYLNDRELRIMVIDPDRAPLMCHLFNMYASGDHTLDTLHAWAKDNGLWSKYGKPLSRANIERILKNPVYYGDFIYSGKHYRGTHDPIVSKELWDRVQAKFKCYHETNFRRRDDFVFTGLMTCAECGCAVVAEMKKGKYVYYHCTGSRKECSSKRSYVREEVLAEQFEGVIRSIKVPSVTIDAIVKTLKDSCADKNRFRDKAIKALRGNIDKLRARIDQAYLDKIDGKIGEDFWRTHSNRWQGELATIENKLSAYDKADVPYYENGRMILELGKHAYELYQRGTREEKRQMLNLVKSNFQLRRATIEYTLKNPFHLMAKWASRPFMLRELDDYRTFLESSTAENLIKFAEKLAA